MYGYKTENGELIINQDEAKIIRKIFRNYMNGMSLTNSAKSAGLTIPHCSVRKMLTRTAYAGYDNYPAIVDEDIFKTVNAEILRKTIQNPRTGKMRRQKPEVKKNFTICILSDDFTDPVERAEYVYSLIQEC